ncbi:MAG: hypothetical protein HQK66_09685, partial [Desulfamplus sp.]|nr:hypothetical protein [Desulfamplus sp.]
MEAELQRFTKSGEEINSAIVECRQIIKDMNEKILETEQIIQQSRKETLELMEDARHLMEWMDNNPGFAIVKVEGKLMAGTRICGRYCEETIKHSISGAVVKEDTATRSSRDNDAGAWRMYISRI